jgi:hypothetical protein
LTPRLYDDVDDACRERKRKTNFEHEKTLWRKKKWFAEQTQRKKMASQREKNKIKALVKRE